MEYPLANNLLCFTLATKKIALSLTKGGKHLASTAKIVQWRGHDTITACCFKNIVSFVKREICSFVLFLLCRGVIQVLPLGAWTHLQTLIIELYYCLHTWRWEWELSAILLLHSHYCCNHLCFILLCLTLFETFLFNYG